MGTRNRPVDPIRHVLPLALLAAAPPPAEILPGFDLHRCSWHATHVVVATEGPTIDGRFEVRETWRGDLRVGATIHVPGMEAMAKRAIREVFTFDRAKPATLVATDRTVLFLRRIDGEFRTAHLDWIRPEDRRGGKREYHQNDVTLSAAWIHRGQAHARIQVMNPGDQVMTSLEMSEAQLRTAVLARLVERDTIESLGRVRPPARRAAGLERFLRVQSPEARRVTMRHLETCGEAAVPALRRLLHDEDHIRLCRDAARALARLDPDTARREMTAIIKQDYELFRIAAPTLKKDWWSDIKMPREKRSKLQAHHGRLYYLLFELGKLGGDIDRQLITAIHKFWMAAPQLTDLHQVPESCHRILSHRE